MLAASRKMGLFGQFCMRCAAEPKIAQPLEMKRDGARKTTVAAQIEKCDTKPTKERERTHEEILFAVFVASSSLSAFVSHVVSGPWVRFSRGAHEISAL